MMVLGNGYLEESCYGVDIKEFSGLFSTAVLTVQLKRGCVGMSLKITRKLCVSVKALS